MLFPPQIAVAEPFDRADRSHPCQIRRDAARVHRRRLLKPGNAVGRAIRLVGRLRGGAGGRRRIVVATPARRLLVADGIKRRVGISEDQQAVVPHVSERGHESGQILGGENAGEEDDHHYRLEGRGVRSAPREEDEDELQDGREEPKDRGHCHADRVGRPVRFELDGAYRVGHRGQTAG